MRIKGNDARGTHRKLVDWCAENGNFPPTWKEEAGSVFVIFAPTTHGGRPEVTTEVATEVKQALKATNGEMSRKKFQMAIGLKNNEHFRKAYLLPALEEGLIVEHLPAKRLKHKTRPNRIQAKESIGKS